MVRALPVIEPRSARARVTCLLVLAHRRAVPTLTWCGRGVGEGTSSTHPEHVTCPDCRQRLLRTWGLEAE